MRIYGIVLAGGQGRRLGGVDKALVRLGGQTLLSRVAGRMASQVEALAVNANGSAARYDMGALPVLPDPPPGDLGPLSGVLVGLDWAAACGADAVLTAAVDTPFLPGDLALRLSMAAEGARVRLAVAESGGRRHPTAALWPVDLREDLRAALASGERRLGVYAERHGAAVAAFPLGRIDPFFNINTPEDLAKAEAALDGDAS